MTSISNTTPFAWLDVMGLAFVAWALATAVVAWRRTRPRQRARRWGPWLLRVVALLAVLAAWFMLGWGLNYRRKPLTSRLDYDRSRVTEDRVRAMARAAVAALNGGHTTAHAESWPNGSVLVARLAPAFATARRQLGLPSAVVPGRPKRTLLGAYFRAAGVAGFTNPWQLEVMLVPDALPFEQPALLAHEWAHLSGITGEAEAGFVGWLVCMNGDAQARYAGWLDVLPRLLAGLGADERRGVSALLAAGPRADYAAIERRLAAVRPVVRDAAWAGYDRFLRANRVESGVRDYDAVAQLLAGTAFDASWAPRLRR